MNTIKNSNVITETEESKNEIRRDKYKISAVLKWPMLYWIFYPFILYFMLYAFLMPFKDGPIDGTDYMAKSSSFAFSKVVRPVPGLLNYRKTTVQGSEFFYYFFYPIDLLLDGEL